MTRRPKLTLERTLAAAPDVVWRLWTTKDGMESWMGPEGFSVTVGVLDLRPGGRIVYEMKAVAPEQVDFMVKAGMPLVNTQRARIVAVDAPRRLVTRDVVDFVPGVDPYEVETVLELEPVEGGTHLRLTFEAMHDAYWTDMATRGRESELGKLADLLSARK